MPRCKRRRGTSHHGGVRRGASSHDRAAPTTHVKQVRAADPSSCTHAGHQLDRRHQLWLAGCHAGRRGRRRDPDARRGGGGILTSTIGLFPVIYSIFCTAVPLRYCTDIKQKQRFFLAYASHANPLLSTLFHTMSVLQIYVYNILLAADHAGPGYSIIGGGAMVTGPGGASQAAGATRANLWAMPCAIIGLSGASLGVHRRHCSRRSFSVPFKHS